jgi:multidrug resistance efflux pump
MPTAFSRSMHVLEADGFHRSTWGLLLVTALLGVWAAWFLLVEVTVYAVSQTARLEADRVAHPVEAPMAGQVMATHLIVGQEVQTGDVLIELDDEAQRLQLVEEATGLTALAAQLGALRREVMAEEAVWREARHASTLVLDEARARHREAEVGARSAEEEAELFARLQARNLSSPLDLLRTRAEGHKRRAAAETLRLAVSRQAGEQRTRESDRQALFERLNREATRLDGERATAVATIERLEHEIERRRIRAPMTGRLGEVANLRTGVIVRQGDTLGSVVPPGDLKIIADFLPPTALGRIQPGQRARLRLEGFPWTQYGSIAATVARVANEPRDARIRVELALTRDPRSPIPLQHGLPGTVAVEVERVVPATLVLRAAGKHLGAATRVLRSEGGNGVAR